MKTKRQNKILELIEQNDIETQEELVQNLLAAGFKVTQATISRDIKDLHLIKVQSYAGHYKYSVNISDDKNNSNVRLRIFKDTVKSIDVAQNLVVVKTLTGSANAAAEVLDTIDHGEVVGSIAGDNTIFIALRNTQAALSFAEELKQIIG